MSKTTKPSPKRKKSPASTAGRARIGRDLFSVLVIALVFGVGLAWSSFDLTSARQTINDAFAGVRELASAKPTPAADPFSVSSIGDKPRANQTVSHAFPVCSRAADRKYCVVDGDTFRLDGVTIRISDIDAPETNPPRCAHEADLGDRATTRLSQLLSAGPFQLARENRDIDKYGRKLRVAMRDGRSLGKKMVSEGLARTWTGKLRPWCGDSASPAG